MKSTKTKSKQTMAKGEDEQQWQQTNLFKGKGDLSSPFFFLHVYTRRGKSYIFNS